MLAELIERIAGRDYRDFIHERITGALGLPRVLGIPPDDQDDIAELSLCGEPASPDELEAAEAPIAHDNELSAAATAIRTAYLFRTTAGSSRQASLGRGAGGWPWDPDVLADATGHLRILSPTSSRCARPPTARSRSSSRVTTGAQTGAGFRHTQSPRTFGHNGAGSQIAWADPDSGLSFCYLTNGRDLNPITTRLVVPSDSAGVCAG